MTTKSYRLEGPGDHTVNVELDLSPVIPVIAAAVGPLVGEVVRLHLRVEALEQGAGVVATEPSEETRARANALHSQLVERITAGIAAEMARGK